MIEFYIDIFRLICRYLDYDDIWKLCRVCKIINDMIIKIYPRTQRSLYLLMRRNFCCICKKFKKQMKYPVYNEWYIHNEKIHKLWYCDDCYSSFAGVPKYPEYANIITFYDRMFNLLEYRRIVFRNFEDNLLLLLL
jgi:hypothetical protein